MPNYKLRVLFEDDAALDNIYQAGERLTLVKQVSPSQANVVWVAFDPFESNVVEWTEDYYVYGTKTQIQSGATIDKLSVKAAQEKNTYKFSGGHFGLDINPADIAGMPPQLSAGQYRVNNTQADGILFGLAQDVVFTGGKIDAAPLNIASVPLGHYATFTPYEKVTVYLHQSIPGMVVTDVSSRPITVTFGGGTNEITLLYQPTSGLFAQV